MSRLPDIIYEDDHLIALNKPAGLLSIPDRFLSNKPNLRSLLEKKYGEIYVLHRLDYNTSGLIVFAKTPMAHANLSNQIENQKCSKEYWALTYKPQKDSGDIDAPIAESLKTKGFYKVHNRGKRAITKYRTIQNWQRYALLSLTLITGRTHQLRVHLKYIGSPLLTDDKYSNSKEFFLSEIKRINRKREEVERPLIRRSSLHARRFECLHPVSSEALQFVAPLPKDMKAVINQLVKRYGAPVEF